MEDKEIKVIEAKFQAVCQQRDMANNQVVNMVGELARKQSEIDELKERLKEFDQEDEQVKE
jgi:chromosome segregation ATPase